MIMLRNFERSFSVSGCNFFFPFCSRAAEKGKFRSNLSQVYAHQLVTSIKDTGVGHRWLVVEKEKRRNGKKHAAHAIVTAGVFIYHSAFRITVTMY